MHITCVTTSGEYSCVLVCVKQFQTLNKAHRLLKVRQLSAAYEHRNTGPCTLTNTKRQNTVACLITQFHTPSSPRIVAPMGPD